MENAVMSARASVKPHAFVRAIDICLPATLIVAIALFGAIQARADSPAAACTKPTTLQVMQLMNIWKAGLASGDADKMASFYTKDATLVAKKDGTPFTGREAIRGYYAELLPRHPHPRFISSNIKADCNVAMVEGAVLYRVTGTRKGTRMLLGGRYKVEFAFSENVWRISNQSLAANPKKLDEPIASL
jgi:uncharacterized protein (TIGR02246 family)